MPIIINAGSENKGGTLEQATINAQGWLKNIHDEGFKDVEMKFIKQHKDGDFEFHFVHKVTGAVATLETQAFPKRSALNSPSIPASIGREAQPLTRRLKIG